MFTYLLSQYLLKKISKISLFISEKNMIGKSLYLKITFYIVVELVIILGVHVNNR